MPNSLQRLPKRPKLKRPSEDRLASLLLSLSSNSAVCSILLHASLDLYPERTRFFDSRCVVLHTCLFCSCNEDLNPQFENLRIF